MDQSWNFTFTGKFITRMSTVAAEFHLKKKKLLNGVDQNLKQLGVGTQV